MMNLSGRHAENAFTRGSLWQSIWRMSWPMLLVMLLNFFVGLTDIYVAGFLGPQVQAVVGFVGQLYFFIIIVANAISIGTVALVSRAVGAGDHAEALKSAQQSLLFGLISAIALAAAGFIFRDIILSPAGFSGEVRTIARTFFALFTAALVPNYIVIIANAIFRAGGEVKLTLLAMAIISSMNIALNFLFVFGVASFPGIGYRGIALATAVSMIMGMVVCLLLFRKSIWKDIFSGIGIVSFDLITRIIRISWPAVLIQISWNAGNIFLYSVLGRLGEMSIAGMAALTNGLRIEAVIYLPAFALNMAASVLTGQNLGAGEIDRAEKIGWKIMFSGVFFVTLMSIPMLLWPKVFSGLVSRDASVLEETARYLRITMLVEPFMAISVILAGCLQGAGDTKGAMAVIVTALWGIRLPLAFLLALTLGYGAAGVWIAMAVSMFFQSIGMTLRFRQGRWKRLNP